MIIKKFMKKSSKYVDFVKCDYIAIGGDYGATVTYWMYAGSSSPYRMVMGTRNII